MKTPFIFGLIPGSDSGPPARWRLVNSKEYWKLKKGNSFITLRKRDSYPKTFILQKDKEILLGYIEPDLYAQLSQDFFSLDKTSKAVKSLIKKIDGEYLIISLDVTSDKIVIYRDALCTIPIFYFNRKNVLVFSNQFNSLLPYVADQDQVNINFQGLIEYLLFLEGGNRTVFNEVNILTERSILIKDSKSLKIVFPKDGLVVPKTKVFKKPQKSFGNFLEKRLDKYTNKIPAKVRFGFELSGGLDSATFAGFYSNRYGRKIISFSMLLPGEYRDSQILKVKSLSKTFGLKNVIFPIDKQFPLSSQLGRKKLIPFYPWREIYFDALSGLLRKVRQKNIDVIFTGMGGDELFQIDPREEVGYQGREEAKFRKSIKFPRFYTRSFKQKFLTLLPFKKSIPTPVVPYSVLGAHDSRNNIFVENGIWPIAPLADPELVNFCRSLPKELRENKKILREYQKEKGYPKIVYSPKVNEDFSYFFDESLRGPLKKLLVTLYKNSALANLGLVNKQILIDDYLNFTQHRSNTDSLYFYAVAVIEILLQSIYRTSEV